MEITPFRFEEIHQEMILELAKFLFPKNHFTFECPDYVQYDFIFIDDSIMGIHWYEFLMCYILPNFKNWDVTPEIWYFTLWESHCQSQGHPVEYIYKLWKEKCQPPITNQ